MMDVVYVYKMQKSNELAWSVKSLKNIEHGRVLVVGDQPDVEGVEHFKPPVNRWSMLSPVHDVINKLRYACSLDISDNFILMNDDFFICKPTEIPVAHRGTLGDHIKWRNLKDNYSGQLKKTKEYLENKGIKDPLSYELHVPMVFNRQRLADLIENTLPVITNSAPILIRSVYGNIYNIGGEQMEDVKTRADHTGLTFVSTNELSFEGRVGDYVRSMVK